MSHHVNQVSAEDVKGHLRVMIKEAAGSAGLAQV